MNSKKNDTEIILFIILAMMFMCVISILPIAEKALDILARYLGVGL